MSIHLNLDFMMLKKYRQYFMALKRRSTVLLTRGQHRPGKSSNAETHDVINGLWEGVFDLTLPLEKDY